MENNFPLQLSKTYIIALECCFTFYSFELKTPFLVRYPHVEHFHSD